MDVLRRLRQKEQTPILVVSARDQEKQKVEALDLGANDYITKPFGSSELLARIRAALRQRAATLSAGVSCPEQYVSDGLTVDFDKRLVRVDGKDIHLTQIEYKIVAFLARNPRKGDDLRCHYDPCLGPLSHRGQQNSTGQYGEYPPEAGKKSGGAAVYLDRDRRWVPHRGGGYLIFPAGFDCGSSMREDPAGFAGPVYASGSSQLWF